MIHTPLQAKRLLLMIAALHIIIIAASNYLVQLPFSLAGFHTTWGAFSFPFIFLASDLTVRLFGAPLARKIVMSVLLPALLISYIVSCIIVDGEYVGLSALSEFNTFVARIALASFVAYFFGQLLDISIFNQLRAERQWWIAPVISTIIGNFLDTLLFFSIAFYASSDPFMAQHWLEIALVDYSFKLIISLLFFLPMYGVLLGFLSAKLEVLAGEKSRVETAL
ncbi:7-cyano-7-deazaguanine/7-aminomethyl-7-deazaguanine transporter [Gammaproteobacteria bacterium AS21]